MKVLVVSMRIIDSMHFLLFAPCGKSWTGMRRTDDVKILAERAMMHTESCENCLTT